MLFNRFMMKKVSVIGSTSMVAQGVLPFSDEVKETLAFIGLSKLSIPGLYRIVKVRDILAFIGLSKLSIPSLYMIIKLSIHVLYRIVKVKHS